MKFEKGTRVRFVAWPDMPKLTLGASELDDLGHVTDETYGAGDQGIVMFEHPNRKLCPDWFYVAVASKKDPEKLLYVGAVPSMVEVVA